MGMQARITIRFLIGVLEHTAITGSSDGGLTPKYCVRFITSSSKKEIINAGYSTHG